MVGGGFGIEALGVTFEDGDSSSNASYKSSRGGRRGADFRLGRRISLVLESVHLSSILFLRASMVIPATKQTTKLMLACVAKTMLALGAVDQDNDDNPVQIVRTIRLQFRLSFLF